MIVNIDALKDEMNKQGLTLETLEKKSDVDKSTLSRLFNGNGCTISTAQKIVKGLGLSYTRAGKFFLVTMLRKRSWVK